ncbi:hypothetical protein LB505_000051 [Fusarium chuoi]|nr:hypothetical protein LB505_000051 [Fusarium chuoi]
MKKTLLLCFIHGFKASEQGHRHGGRSWHTVANDRAFGANHPRRPFHGWHRGGRDAHRLSF